MEIQRQSKNLIFSYQGAFGPPTYGHYQSMLFFSRMIQEYIEDKEYNVTMLFMPTAISGSKKHLQPTQDLRIETLKIFCEKLGREFNDPRFSFVASRLEYDLYPTTKSTGTIHTIKEIIGESNIISEKPAYLKLFDKNNGDELILGMGADNMYQLPYWGEVERYIEMVDKIFIVPRIPSPEDEHNLGNFILDNKVFKLQKIIPWKFKFSKLQSILENPITIPENNIEIEGENTYIKKNFDLSTIIESDIQLKLKLPEIIVSPGSPMPTSSSMMRYFLSIYEDKDLHIIKNLMFGSTELLKEEESIVNKTIEFYKIYFEDQGKKPDDSGYLAKYSEMFGLKGGKIYIIKYSL